MLDWDLWLGPAPQRPYNPIYHPFKWRGWWDFGTGALGDMGCHIIDVPYYALDLGAPASVEAASTQVNSETAPKVSKVVYEFAARSQMPPVQLNWYDGGLRPPRPPELEEGRRMGSGNGGVLFVGDKGKLVCGCYGKGPRIIPETKMKEYKRPDKTIPRVEGHHQDWLRACKGGKTACSSFDYSGPLTETVLLGNVAIRLRKKIYWDANNLRCANAPEADEFIRREYRKGWTL
jgi:predicted dehydrogenase